MYRQDTLPAFYFPTTVVWVDDDPHLPQSLSMLFARDTAFRFFTNPLECLTFLNEDYQSPLLRQRYFNSKEKSRTPSTVELNFGNLHQLVYSPDRFQTIASVILDYAMPQMNGVRCSENIQDHALRKIMLTGEADYNIAVNAFNKGIIQKFIMKSEEDLRAELHKSLQAMEYNFFLHQSHLVVKALSERMSPRIFALLDPIFVRFFHTMCQDNNICEYYLMDEEGSFLLVNRRGELSYLAVLSEEGLQEQLELATDIDAPEEVLAPMQNKSKIPCLFADNILSMFPSRWLPYLYPCQLLEGQQPYYYAYIDAIPERHPLHAEPIVPYNHFLEAQV
jgi:CheY-like chemotaxis protein